MEKAACTTALQARGCSRCGGVLSLPHPSSCPENRPCTPHRTPSHVLCPVPGSPANQSVIHSNCDLFCSCGDFTLFCPTLKFSPMYISFESNLISAQKVSMPLVDMLMHPDHKLHWPFLRWTLAYPVYSMRIKYTSTLQTQCFVLQPWD